MIGTGAAIALGLGSIGGNLLGAKMQSGASKEAAKLQSASADKAMALQERLANQAMGLQGTMWEGVKGLYNPYTASAPASLGALHSFLGIPGASAAQSQVPMGTYGPPMNPPQGYGARGQPGYPGSTPNMGQMGPPPAPIAPISDTVIGPGRRTRTY